MIEFLSWKSPASIREISEFLQKDRRYVRDRLKDMEQKGQVTGKLTREYFMNKFCYEVHKYWITNEGLEWLKSNEK